MRIFALVAAVALISGSAQAATLEGERTLGGDLSAKASGDLFDAAISRVAMESLPDASPRVGMAVAADRYSGLPEPSVWAMMIAGFGAAGSVMRRRVRQATYRLEEYAPRGLTLTEEFAAPDDASALSRATSVVSGDFKLWRGDTLIEG